MWFDGQADQFDDAAGLEPEVGRRIAQVIVELTDSTSDDLMLDVGAGTGAIGLHFATLSTRYVGLDSSQRMLGVFQRKLRHMPRHMLLLQADSDCPWPIGDHVLTAVFASRVAHHLQIQHLVQEVFRVCRLGGHLLLGRITRDADSLPSRLQRYKRSLLAEHGLCTGGGGQALQQIVDTCCAHGATALPPITVTQWPRTTTPRQLLNAWEGKPQLTSSAQGKALGMQERAEIVSTLTGWARQEFGNLDDLHEFSEAYALYVARLPR